MAVMAAVTTSARHRRGGQDIPRHRSSQVRLEAGDGVGTVGYVLLIGAKRIVAAIRAVRGIVAVGTVRGVVTISAEGIVAGSSVTIRHVTSSVDHADTV